MVPRTNFGCLMSSSVLSVWLSISYLAGPYTRADSERLKWTEASLRRLEEAEGL